MQTSPQTPQNYEKKKLRKKTSTHGMTGVQVTMKVEINSNAKREYGEEAKWLYKARLPAWFQILKEENKNTELEHNCDSTANMQNSPHSPRNYEKQSCSARKHQHTV